LTGGPASGVHLTDVTNASRTQLFDLGTLDWNDALVEAFTIPRAVLPRIGASSASYGAARIAALRGVPVAGMLGDQQAALVGQACFEPGEAKNTYGTGCFMLLNTGTRPVPSTAGLITTVAYQIGDEPPHYALEGSIAIAGALVQWLRDNLGLIAKSADIEALARQVEDNGDVYFVPAFSGLFAPYWQDTARGVLAGLTRYANRAHIARAALEATAYQTRDVLEAMEKDAHLTLTELRVDGGMGRERVADAIPGGPACRARRPAADHRDDGARRRVRGGACGRLLGESGRAQTQLGRRQTLAARDGRRAPRKVVWRLEKSRAPLVRLGGTVALTRGEE
jgi:glycerol kinase